MTIESPDYWQDRYQRHDVPWDLGEPAPALVEWLASHDGRGLRAIVPGCGPGHDALALARAGFAVTAVDFAEAAVATTRAAAGAAGVTMDVLQADLFSLDPAHVGRFDLWFEHTCFCAIDPAMRPRYVETAARLVVPGGRLLAVFFTHGEPDGPPYDVRPHEIAPLFAPHFAVERLEPVTCSVAKRQGEETLGELRRRESVA